mmetsp:Transcript_49731/g.127943  ORF Transcript_49731/g.127943 Transcript_49731/m.127943 type:complete len:124 (+) Transcript_49731:1045-1416(+)
MFEHATFCLPTPFYLYLSTSIRPCLSSLLVASQLIPTPTSSHHCALHTRGIAVQKNKGGEEDGHAVHFALYLPRYLDGLVYVYIHTCVYVYMYAYTYVYVYVCMRVYVYVCMHAWMCTDSVDM